MCILPLSEPLLKKLNGCKSPTVVDVRSSVILEIWFYFCPLFFLSRFSLTTLLFSFAIFITCACSQNYRTLGLLLSIIVEFVCFLILVVNLTWSPFIFLSSLIRRSAMRLACY